MLHNSTYNDSPVLILIKEKISTIAVGIRSDNFLNPAWREVRTGFSTSRNSQYTISRTCHWCGNERTYMGKSTYQSESITETHKGTMSESWANVTIDVQNAR